MDTNTRIFVEKAAVKHGSTYDYSAVIYTNSKAKVVIGCSKHGQFSMTPNSHLSGQGCPTCGREAIAAARRATSRTWKQFVEAATKAHNGKYTYIHEGQERVPKDASIRAVCPRHGEFVQGSHVHLTGHGCPKCGSEATAAARRLNPDAFMSDVRGRYPELEFRSSYLGSHEPLTAYCTKHKMEFTRKAHTFARWGCGWCGHERGGAKMVGNQNRQSHNLSQIASGARTFAAWAEAYAGPLVLRHDTYTTISVPMRAVCPKHGDVAVIPKNLIKGHGCLRCAQDESRGLRLPIEALKQRFAEKFGDAFAYDWSTLVGTHYPMTMRCMKHGEFKSSPHNFLSTAFGCPKCGRATSRGQKEIADFVRSLGFDIEEDVWGVLPQVGRSRAQIDVWVPSKKLGIEYHGIYYHAEKDEGDEVSKMKHLDKWRRAESVGVRLLQVFEDEWIHRQDAVKNRIRAQLGVAERRYARRLTLEVIDGAGHDDVHPAHQFFAKWHTQGAGRRASKYYVLKDGAEVVAAMCFMRTGHGGAKALADYELSRFATKGTVVGGFSRLLKAARADMPGATIMSYCDLRYGNGAGYARCGFREAGATDPDWWWLPGNNTGRRVGRQATQAQRIHLTPELHALALAHPEASGETLAYLAGWRKVYGTGSKRFVLV